MPKNLNSHNPIGRADIVASRLLAVAAERHPNPLLRDIAPLAVPFISGQFQEVLGPGTMLGSLAQGLVAHLHNRLDREQQALEAQAAFEEAEIARAMSGTPLDPFRVFNAKPSARPAASVRVDPFATGNLPGGKRRKRVRPMRDPISGPEVNVIDVPVEVI
jgi:hypothetical protein